jgi:hypothetical protein
MFSTELTLNFVNKPDGLKMEYKVVSYEDQNIFNIMLPPRDSRSGARLFRIIRY